MRLGELQARLTADLVGGVGHDARLLSQCADNAGVDAATRLDLYRANVRAAHLAALDAAFPVTRDVLGPRYWHRLLADSISSYGSATSDLNAYGDFVPGLLNDEQPRRPELAELDYLGDLARMEWGIHRLRRAPADDAFAWPDFLALGAGRQARARLATGHGTTLFRSAFPVDVIWSRHTGTAPAEPAWRGSLACCLHRDHRFDIHVTRLTDRETALFDAVRTGRSLADIETVIDATHRQWAMRCLFDWIGRGWIVGFEVD